MALFQISVLNTYLKLQEEQKLANAFKKFSKYFHNPVIQENIRNSKEEQFQATFLTELFVNVLGYTLNPQPDFNLSTEFKNENNARKADGAFLKDGAAIGVIELKGTNTKDLEGIRRQAFDYKVNQKGCVYVITSNFEKLRFYINDATEFIEFDLFLLTSKDFALLYLCLQKENILNNLPLKIKESSVVIEEQITKDFYKDYSVFKRELYRDLVRLNAKTLKNIRLSDPDFSGVEESNPDYAKSQAQLLRLEKNVKLELFKKSQKLIDRFLFIFFAEDRGLLPPNSTIRIVKDWNKLKELDAVVPLYDRFKLYFSYLDQGRKSTDSRAEIFAYNGGLFKPDNLLDRLEINDELLAKHTTQLSKYNFESQVDVNILGHIFENSLNEIESINAEIEGADFDKQKSKRKKDGVFYTPKYITKYIVENTLGKLCEEKKTELGFREEEYYKGRKRRQKDTLEALIKILDDYRAWLLQLTICDPACGSGAFLNQALDFLIKEHRYIDELKAKLLGGGLVFSDIETTILENNIYGVDINEESIEIAKLSLWLRTAQPRRKLNDLSSNIKCGNSLIDDKKVAGDKAFKWEEEFKDVFEKGGFDVVIGNPPYVVYIKSIFGEGTINYVNRKYSFSEYNPNTYALFTDLALNKLVQKGGFLGFIIPNSWLEGQYFSRMRNNLFRKNIEEIVYLKNTAFDEVVETVIIHVRNSESSTEEIKLTANILENDSSNHKIDISKYSKGYNPFITNMNPLLNKLENEYDKLKKHALVYRGLETRNNQKWLSESKISDKYIPILLGKDVNRYSISYSGSYVNFIQKEMKSNANIEMYTQPKILMRRTGSSIIATLDEENLMALKNLYLIIPNSEDKIYSLLGQLNSRLMNFYHKSKTSGENKAFAQFKGTYISDFPVCFKNHLIFKVIIEELISKVETFNVNSRKFLKYFSSMNELEKIPKKLQSWHNLEFGEFIKELNKAIKASNKVRTKEGYSPILELTKKDEFEWMELFEENKKKALELQREIENTEKEIDLMVYKLYDLTHEEVLIIDDVFGMSKEEYVNYEIKKNIEEELR